MAPTPSPVLFYTSNPPLSRYHHRLRRRVLNSSHHAQGRFSALSTEQFKPRTPDATLQPSPVLEGAPLLPIVPTSSGSAVFKPSGTRTTQNPSQGQKQPGDTSGNIVAAIAVIVLIVSGLIGLVIGGEMLRRQAKSKSLGRHEAKAADNTTDSPHQRVKTSREGIPCDEKTQNLLTRPLPIPNREPQEVLSDVCPMRSTSRAKRDPQSTASVPVLTCPQTTWSDSEFSPVTLYAVPPRTILACIPEEHEGYESETNGDFSAMPGVGLQWFRSVTLDPQTDQLKTLPEAFGVPESSRTRAQRDSRDFQTAGDDDTKSLESLAPDMTLDGGESGRSSIVSLKSLERKEGLGEEIFEPKRAQTRSVQMNKGVLLSLSSKTLDDSRNLEPSSAPDPVIEYEREMSLEMLCGNFSAVSLDEFPSPPSILPVIPSFVSGF